MQPTNYQNYLAANPSTSPTTSTTKTGGSWLDSLFPTVGAIGGGLLGSVVGPLGGIAGASAGSALGQALENKSTGSNGSVVGAAGEGALGQGIGLGVGKLAGGLLGKLGSNAAEKVAQSDATAALEPYQGLKTDGLVPTLDHMKSLGVDISNPENLKTAAAGITGENGAINGIKNQLITQAGSVKIDPADVMNSIQSPLANAQLTAPQAARAQNYIRKLMGNLNPNGTLNGEADPNDVFDAIKQLGSARSSLNMNGESGKALAGVYDAARTSLQNSLYNNSGADALAAAYKATPEDIAAITKATGGNKQLADYAVNSINNAKSIQDLRGAEAPFVKASQLGDLATTTAASKLPSATVGSMGSGADSMTGAGLLGAVGGFHPAAAAVGGIAKAASKIPPELVQDSTGALARLTKGLAPVGGQLLTHANDIANNNEGGATPVSAQENVPSGTSATSGTGGTQGYDPNQLASYLMRAIQVNPYNASSLAPILAQVLQPLQQANTAQSSLQALEGTYQNAGGGQGELPGLLSAIAALIPGTAANQYNKQKEATQSQLTAAGVPAALPSLLASGGTAAQGFGNASNILSSLGNTSTFQGTPSFAAPSVLSGLPTSGY